MKPRVAVVVGLMVLLLIVNLAWPQDPSPISSSSFGRSGSGHGALFDLLTLLDATTGRSLEAADRLEGEQTLWWIDPRGVCDGRIAMRGNVDVLDPDDVAWVGRGWIEAGGTAVVFLQSADPGGLVIEEQEELVACDAIAGVALPLRSRFRLGGSAAPASVRDGLRGEERRQQAPLEAPSPALFVTGPIAGGESADRESPDRRVLATGSPFAFDEALDWVAAAELHAPDGRAAPFVLERALGRGRLVVVADSGFAHNRWLDAADSSLLALDLVRSYGVPRFDEREHGLLPETSAIRYIARSAALPVFAGLAVLGLLYTWRGASLPARCVQEFDPAVPTLETYVSSMTALYAGTNDHGEVLARYRELVAGRIRRHFGLPPEVGREALADRIRRAGALPPERLAVLAQLTESQPVATEAELERAVQELDQLVREITR